MQLAYLWSALIELGWQGAAKIPSWREEWLWWTPKIASTSSGSSQYLLNLTPTATSRVRLPLNAGKTRSLRSNWKPCIPKEGMGGGFPISSGAGCGLMSAVRTGFGFLCIPERHNADLSLPPSRSRPKPSSPIHIPPFLASISPASATPLFFSLMRNRHDDTDVHLGGIGSRGPGRFWSTLISAVLAAAFFRCWHILIFFAAWSTAISVISATTYNLGISPTLLTVLGTVLGFVISYRTTSSFERYNEGRRYWSQIVLASRTFVRLVWIHVPETMALGKDGMSEEETKARVLVEKKAVVNLVEAFAVAVKHYLRGEEGIYYVDLYHLVKFLPAYALPAGLSSTDFHSKSSSTKDPSSLHAPSIDRRISSRSAGRSSLSYHRPTRSTECGRSPQTSPIIASAAASAAHLPLPADSLLASEKSQVIPSASSGSEQQTIPSSRESIQAHTVIESIDNVEDYLLPVRNPPKVSYFDVFPFPSRKNLAARHLRPANLPTVTANLPHEISLYLNSYVASLQARKAIDPPTTTTLINAVTQLVDALTGLERILTTPIPLSYSIHIWVVTLVYCFVLPFQLWLSLKWLTIPGTTIASLIFFGFLVAGEEIENPSGYDRNDLNLEYFTHNIIREELHIITTSPPPNPADWAFSAHNDCLFTSHKDAERVPHEEWVSRRQKRMLAELAVD